MARDSDRGREKGASVVIAHELGERLGRRRGAAYAGVVTYAGTARDTGFERLRAVHPLRSSLTSDSFTAVSSSVRARPLSRA